MAFLAFAAMAVRAADDPRLAMMLRAQADFERVELAGAAQLPEAVACVQSQAAALAAGAPSDAALLHYRKGFCLLAQAAVTHRAEAYSEAAGELDRALEAWPARIPAAGKKAPPDPVSPGLRALDDIAHLEAGPPDAARERARTDLASAVVSPICAANVMAPADCQQAVETGREWMGWMALHDQDIAAAALDFSASKDGWADWIAGLQAFAAARYPAAVEHYQTAIARWDADRGGAPVILESLAPPPDLAGALAELGGAQLLAGNASGAIATLDRAVHEDPARAHVLYLRARAREARGDSTGALADYSLASRAAFAAAKDLASGEAHLYRGILLYRRKDPARAEEEFSSALNFAIPDALRPDAEAWRHLAAVAAGSCGASRGYLERSLAAVSPFFPKDEARAAAAACPATASRAGGPAGE